MEVNVEHTLKKSWLGDWFMSGAMFYILLKFIHFKGNHYYALYGRKC